MKRRARQAALAILSSLLFLAVAPLTQAQVEICATGVNCASRTGGMGGMNIRCDKPNLGPTVMGTIQNTSVVMSMNVLACSFSYGAAGMNAVFASPHATHYVSPPSPTPPSCQLQITTSGGGSFICSLTTADGLPVELMDFSIEE